MTDLEPDGRESPPRFLGGPVLALDSQAIPYIYVAAKAAGRAVAFANLARLDLTPCEIGAYRP